MIERRQSESFPWLAMLLCIGVLLTYSGIRYWPHRVAQQYPVPKISATTLPSTVLNSGLNYSGCVGDASGPDGRDVVVACRPTIDLAPAPIPRGGK